MNRTEIYYKQEYIERERSLRDIAKEHNTYPNKIRRELIAFGFTLRDKSEAQRVALKHGRQQHPTKGKRRPSDVRIKISTSVLKAKRNATTKKNIR